MKVVKGVRLGFTLIELLVVIGLYGNLDFGCRFRCDDCLPCDFPGSDLQLQRPQVKLVGSNFVAEHSKPYRSISHDLATIDPPSLVGAYHRRSNMLASHQTEA